MNKQEIIKEVERLPRAIMIKKYNRYKMFTMYRIMGGRMSELPRNAVKEDIYKGLVKIVSIKRECILDADKKKSIKE
ncbi:hypothetical protein UT300012_23660 [Paraclostridium bifermentans]